ncbi:MAG: class I SAM-dependent methyltransferase [Acidimicrobiia bacterium]|jgi:SAM-dependent methyltransferase
MVGARAYNWMYRYWAPWDKVGLRKDLVELLDSGRVDPERFPRAIDLGCGTGANVVHLAGLGYDAWGVDFSEVAIRKARERAATAGVAAEFVIGDLTATTIKGVDGRFDLILDFGTLDDLRGENRMAMARTVTRLSRPGSVFLEYCFYGVTEELPRFSFKGTSKMSHIAPGELEELFGAHWDVEPFASYEEWKIAAFLLTRRSGAGAD